MSFKMDKDSIHNWEQFRKTGLLQFVNIILHAFGWAITYIRDNNNKIMTVQPRRITFRGFSAEDNDKMYYRIGKYMERNGKQIVEEAFTDDEIKNFEECNS